MEEIDKRLCFAAVEPMDKNQVDQDEYDVTQPRCAAYEKVLKVAQDAVY